MRNQRVLFGALCASSLAALLFLSGTGCTTSPKRNFPGANWEQNPSGLSPRLVSEVSAFVRTLETTGLMVVKSGKVVYKYGDVAEVSYIASVRKSVLSMLYGPYVTNGMIRLDTTLKELGMSDVGGLLPIEERAKVFDLITARSGVYHSASNDGDLLEYAPERGSQEPGSYWLYNNWDFNVAGAVFERMTGKDIYDALRDDLAIPIGMQDFDRERQQKDEKPEASQYPAYTMWLSTQDMARLGYLMLRDGRWRDRQIIPADWVKRSTRVVIPSSEQHPEFMQSGPFGYGYMWWVWDSSFATGPYKGAYTAAGAHGQWITVLPELDMVVAHKTFWSSTGGPRHSVHRDNYYRLLDLLTGAHPASADELRQWKEAEHLEGIDSDPAQIQPSGVELPH
jgi:CubicO group peptidase (beta-lactamase class C family)